MVLHVIAATPRWARPVGKAEGGIVLSLLALVDLALVAGLIVMVMFSGYENFVSKIDPSA